MEYNLLSVFFGFVFSSFMYAMVYFSTESLLLKVMVRASYSKEERQTTCMGDVKLLLGYFCFLGFFVIWESMVVRGFYGMIFVNARSFSWLDVFLLFAFAISPLHSMVATYKSMHLRSDDGGWKHYARVRTALLKNDVSKVKKA